jgi:hypothetical protein
VSKAGKLHIDAFIRPKFYLFWGSHWCNVKNLRAHFSPLPLPHPTFTVAMKKAGKKEKEREKETLTAKGKVREC